MKPLNMHVVTLGSGPRHVVILPGLLGQAKNWQSIQKTLLARLGVEFTVHALDLRNHGRSAHTLEHSISLMAQDCAMFVNEILKKESNEESGSPNEEIGGIKESVSLIGHSMGGKVAMELSLTFPELIDRLMVVDVGPWKYSGVTGEMGVIENHLDAMRALPLSEIYTMEMASEMLKYAAPRKVDRDFLLTNLWIPESGNLAMWQIPLQTLKDSIPDIRNWKSFLGASYDGPTFFLGGTRSQYLRYEMRPTIMRLFPNARMKWINGAGHWVHAEKPAAFLNEAIAFLKV